jgi:hypothetical protein
MGLATPTIGMETRETKITTVAWLVSAPFSMFVHQKVVRNPHNFAEAKKGYFLASD